MGVLTKVNRHLDGKEKNNMELKKFPKSKRFMLMRTASRAKYYDPLPRDGVSVENKQLKDFYEKSKGSEETKVFDLYDGNREKCGEFVTSVGRVE